jgi:hypothetical protein
VQLGHLRHQGEDHPNAKLTAKQVLRIRKLYATGKFQQKDLAAALVSRGHPFATKVAFDPMFTKAFLLVSATQYTLVGDCATIEPARDALAKAASVSR